ncbi:MAG: NAD(P)-dependent glycerol-3-phosphate dehydrogenase [Brevinematales bacterium]|nr:NAD(P)-dependent glycerol-3-phosphate dehydrogenase [Brevinematales bacterium]
MRIGLIGAGSWGIALAVVFSDRNNVRLWVRKVETLEYILKHRESPDYLKGVRIPDSVNVTNSCEDMSDRDVIFVVVPSKYLRQTLRLFKGVIDDKPIISCTKGIEVESVSFPTDIIKEEIGSRVVGVLSGPSFAEEVARKLPCAITLSTSDDRVTSTIQSSISTSYFRVYGWNDIRGMEIAGSYKNVIAISAGIIDGLELGYNAKASLITRGLSEIVRLGVRLGGKLETFYGLAGIGDLILTCTGRYSRNRQLGEMIAKGVKPEDFISSSKMIPEGYYNVVSIKKLSEKQGVELPIANEVYEIIYNNKNPLNSLRDLMSRQLKLEF